jgi:hypothetical protein
MLDPNEYPERPRRRVWPVVLLVVLVVAAGVWGVTTILRRGGLSLAPGGRPLFSVALPTPGAATPWPTLTLRAVSPRPTPTAAAPNAGATTVAPTAVAPSSAGQGAFRIELTEEQLAASVNDEEGGFSQGGFQISNARVNVTTSQVIATFDATHTGSGVSGEITAVTEPRVVDGQLFLRVVDFSLGDNIRGFARLIANALVQSLLDRYNTGNGIPVPLDSVGEVTGVELQDGRVIVSGNYR